MSTPNLETSHKNKDENPNTGKKRSRPKELGTLKIVVFLAISMALVTYSAHYFINYQPTPVAEKFFADRKDVVDYQKYKDSESAKKKAEKNIYLQ